MGRGGVGGGGGGHSSGGHSSSHSVSGHRASSSSSAGSGRRGGLSSSSHSSGGGFSGFGGGYRRPSPPPPPPPPRHYGYSRRRYGSSYNRTVVYHERTSWTSVIVTIVALIVLILVCRGCTAMESSSVTTHQGLNKTKITPLAEYRTDCVLDEENWFADPYLVGQQLKGFYNKTGIQPYVAIFSSGTVSGGDSAKENYADEYYKANIDNEGALLYCYFADSNPNAEGYSVLIGGSATKAFFDSAATNAFWDIYDSYYFNSSITEEQLIVNTFNDTAEICLSNKTVTNTSESGAARTAKGVLTAVIVIGCVVLAIMIAVKIVKMRNARKAAEAAETERILNTPLEKLGENSDLVDKYTNNNGQ